MSTRTGDPLTETRNGRIDSANLLAHLREAFRIDWHGIHGGAHWSRVRLNGFDLSRGTAANQHVVELFAFFHDCARRNEHVDDGHGSRGYECAKRLRGRFFDASDEEMELLREACSGHSDGRTEAELTVAICWDADRLDLWRVGITPNARYLCTPQAREARQIETSTWRSEQWLRSRTKRSHSR